MEKTFESARSRMGRSRLGGVARSLGEPARTAGHQLSLPIPGAEPTGRTRREVLSGAVLVPDWLDPDAQREIVAAFREWSLPPGRLGITIRETGL